ncbi:MAG: UDP-galactopyranose mutase [Bacillota bacterium]
MTKKPYDFLIVGAGLFGSVFAHEATKKGYTCKVIEKRNHIAGNIYTKKIHGIDVHFYGPHIFHTHEKYIWDYICDKVSMDTFINQPLARYKDKLYSLPFSMYTFKELFGTINPQEAKQRIEEETKPYIKDTYNNLEEKALSLVGKTIYETLIKGYTEKQWGRKATDIPAKIIERLPLRFTYNANYFNDAYQGIPSQGYTHLIETLLTGIDVDLNTEFLKNKEAFESLADNVIYTGKIDDYFDQCFGALEYRSLRFETTYLDTNNFQGNAVINYTEKSIPYTRVVEHKFFSRNQDQKGTVITKEYPLEYKEGLEAYYPIGDKKNKQRYYQYEALTKELKHVFFGGRLGSYRYYDMDDTIMASLSLVKALTKEEGIT